MALDITAYQIQFDAYFQVECLWKIFHMNFINYLTFWKFLNIFKVSEEFLDFANILEILKFSGEF